MLISLLITILVDFGGGWRTWADVESFSLLGYLRGLKPASFATPSRYVVDADQEMRPQIYLMHAGSLG
ncbi:MAG: hypothetical protein D6698_11015 [Gammaproteobacteria bacterium]|nr:MAG: hypothetical protein D6698_11015 [Gammaproteobacteria bacterium]